MRGSRFVLPTPRRGNPLWGVASVVLHLVVGAGFVAATLPGIVPVPPTVIVLYDPTQLGPREYPLPPVTDLAAPAPELPTLGEAEGDEGESEGREVREVPITVPDVTVSTEFLDSIPRLDTVFRFVGIDTDADEAVGGDDAEGTGPIGTRRRLGPAYADGLLWIDPFEASLGVVGPSESRVIHVARVDAAIRERIKAFIDSMPRDSFALPPPPTWNTRVGEATWGIDQNWLYLGDFKVPSALLALLSLLPLPDVDYDRARDAANLARVREDIIRSARAMDNAEQFKDYVRQLRERKDREREERLKAKRDTVKPNGT